MKTFTHSRFLAFTLFTIVAFAATTPQAQAQWNPYLAQQQMVYQQQLEYQRQLAYQQQLAYQRQLAYEQQMAYQRQMAYYQQQMAYQRQMAQQSALQRLPFSPELIENPYIREGRGGWRADRYNRYMQSNKNWDAGVAQDIFDMVSGDYDLQRELRASLPETFNPKEAADWAGVAVHALPIITNAIDKGKFDKGSWNETLNLALPMIIGAISNN